MNFKQLDKNKLKEISSKGGKQKAINMKKRDKTFKDIVNENMTEKDMKELVEGILASGKKGNIKAINMILNCLKKD